MSSSADSSGSTPANQPSKACPSMPRFTASTRSCAMQEAMSAAAGHEATTASAATTPRSMRITLSHSEILELPGIGVHVAAEELGAALDRSPVAVDADEIAEVGPGDVEHDLVVELLGLEGAFAGIADRPDDPREHPRHHLEARRRVVRRDLSRLTDGEPRAVPIHALLRAHQQHAEL